MPLAERPTLFAHEWKGDTSEEIGFFVAFKI
jgi:hypothetical protein